MADTTRADDLEIVTDTTAEDARGAALRVEDAGDRRGLRFERYFTRPDVHPYDELEWELRDAVLKNWRDGSISFEQRDVEFPSTWSMMATQIVSQKYFRGTLGSPERERSVKHMIDRVADTITGWGIEGGYFADEDAAEVFNHELKHLLVNQKAAFNSPVWFNVGVEETPQCSACFILSVEDTMSSILNWYVEEGTIFKGGSGAGINLSTIRSSKEQLKGGGEASGPVSFMRGADASAGTIKSGGKTRRAAKMVILNVDHPDIEEFIWTKAREEDKIRILREAGFDMDLDSPDYASVQYQNANNSVRVTDEFMRAYEEDREYDLRAVTTGEVVDRKSARDVMRQISEAAWQCADPGVQYDTTINDWHTCPESGRINASNPCCFVGETLVDTEEGLVRFDVLEKRHAAGETLPRVRTYDRTAGCHTLRPINSVWVAGESAGIVEVTTAGGLSLRCTPEHRFLTLDGTWVEASDLTPGHRLRGVDASGADLPDEVVTVERLEGETARVFDLEVAGTRNFAVTSDGAVTERAVIVHNSEYMHLDNSACNLASLNLKKFYDYDAGRFDVEAFRRAVEVVFTAQEIIVGFSSYPTEAIGRNAIDSRELGRGYATLGGLLMSIGLPDDSDEGRAWCGAITALMTGHAYRTSAEIAKVTGPFNGYKKNEQPMLRVIGKHRDAVEQIDPRPVQPDLMAAARHAWDEALEFGREHGYRNSQATVTAPTGTIGLMMDCDTTGIEPDLGLVKTKKLVGGGSITIVNQTVPQALDQLGYSEEQVEAIVAYIDENKTILGAPALRDEHKKVFQCAMGDDAIHYLGHVRMRAAAQPFISGAISKCIVGETLISTEDGLIRIDSLHEDEAPDSFRDHVMEVASLDGTQKTDAFYYGGVRPVREVVLRSGHRIVGTPNHRLLVATDAGLEWKMLHDIEVGDHVAQRYGAELWSRLPHRFDGFAPSAAYGSQKAVTIPAEMSADLAFLLGAFVAEGHIARSTWTTTITNADDGVLERIAEIIRSQFGVEARVVHPDDRCSYVAVASKTIVEFLTWLGCGEGAANKRIPDAVLRSPREMVLAFLQGLALDAYTAAVGSGLKWAICLASNGLLDDLQAVLTNLGVVHSRITRHNAAYDKDFDEVYVSGNEARRMIRLVPFAEADKAERAQALMSRLPTQSTADVVPGITPSELYGLIPYRTTNDRGELLRTEFNFLADKRTKHVSRTTLERVAAIPGIDLPDWLWRVLDDGLHFSPVASVEDAGQREVYDVSVPGTHAFVGNGIVNHNTVNMPEEATVEDVEQLHLDAWKLGIKAIAIYRDNCKVAQPLSVTKKEEKAVPEAVTSPVPMRRKLPKTRPSQTISFRVGDAKGYVTAGEYPGDGIGEIFVKLGKQGSTLSGLLDAFAISVSIGLQYGVPLESYVSKFMNMRFEPAGMTDDEEIRFATSLVDYMARKLAIEYLPYEKREELGIFTLAERTALLDENQETEQAVPTSPSAESVERSADLTEVAAPAVPIDHDAPMCFDCGIKMQRAGACYVCNACGTTSGCS